MVSAFLELHGYDPAKGGEASKALANVKDDLFQILFEATETTASSLFWTLQQLAAAPDWQAAIADDVQGRSAMKAVIAEALRLHSVFALALPRSAKADYRLALDRGSLTCEPGDARLHEAVIRDIGELVIREGDKIAFPLEAINRSRLYDEPDHFHPERHYDRAIYSQTMKTTFLGGAHACSGMGLYLFIAECMLSELLRHHRLARDSGNDGKIGVHYSVVTRPDRRANTGLLLTARDEEGALQSQRAAAGGKCPFHHG